MLCKKKKHIACMVTNALLVVIISGCASPKPALPLSQEQLIEIASDNLRRRNGLFPKYKLLVDWNNHHWIFRYEPIEYDGAGNRIAKIGSHERYVLLDSQGQLIAILGGGKATVEEMIKWEQNLRELHYKGIHPFE